MMPIIVILYLYKSKVELVILYVDNTLKKSLEKGLAEIAINYNTKQFQQLVLYIYLLEKWNNIYNLTGCRNRNDLITKHILDSLSIVPYIKKPMILDVGTGAGLPGIPIAIFMPNNRVTMLDSNGKKIRFVRQVFIELNLKNTMAEQIRVEKFEPASKFDIIISRAFSSISQFVTCTKHLVKCDGYWFAMKGKLPEKELQEINDTIAVDKIERLFVPKNDSERHLIILKYRDK